jgi:putative addiction module killer protein
MRGKARKLILYETSDGKCPWHEWFHKLSDRKAQAALDARLLRLQRGHFGDCKGVGEGVFELRIHYGPGYRVYFGEDGDSLVVLLSGGSKRTQKRDIARAKAYWADYRSQ